ncbi:PleD family two-component system response regulator [Methylocella silvestris]|uniref:diguanylate cyclase n=1 Tax=Methylocella silvestris TaxID=199596 RepID=A0A2J7TH02_METSI|nr:PleD family two-component system response regulator [Methylocella silvestris]PNG26042.1 PleD family two-component system response regulator [Methylocella silvestris]
MTARVLVVDDNLPNVKLLEARLSTEYYEVVTASNGADALAICARGECDIVLLDVMMPGMNGFEVCRRLKADPLTAHIPVVMVTALDQTSDRLMGLEAGADDFLTKPIDEAALLARVRSLARLRLSLDELRMRAMRAAKMGIGKSFDSAAVETGLGGRVLVVDDRRSSAGTIYGALKDLHEVEVEPDASEALIEGAAGGYDLLIVSLSLEAYDGLRLCSQIRSIEATRELPILAIAEPEERVRMLRCLDLGVNDYLLRPIERHELVARVRTQLRRKRYADNLREKVEASLEMAVVDALTGLHNRRFFDGVFPSLMEEAKRKARPLSVMMFDIDHFKSVNDAHGHEAGDRLLQGLAGRVRALVRGSDMFCRLSGDEFVILMPDTRVDVGAKVAERVRAGVAGAAFPIGKSRSLSTTISIGLAESAHAGPDLLREADRALYRSKEGGRNRVFVDTPAEQSGKFTGFRVVRTG